MTFYHVDKVTLFKKWFSLCTQTVPVCFADIDTEDDSFHGNNTGVFHLGFDREKLKQLLHDAGFCDVRDTTTTAVIKEVAGQGTLKFPVFLIIATRKSVKEQRQKPMIHAAIHPDAMA
jgi:hypothetical protein